MSKDLYRIRKSWEDAKSQIGAYALLANAIKKCNEAGPEYKVYSSKGTQMYPKAETIKENIEEGGNIKMKYSETNKPLICMMTQSTCYTKTSPMEVKGILWHSTGANNPTLKRYVQPNDDAVDREYMLQLIGVNQYKNDWNHIYHEAGLNAWIGKLADGTVASIQTMPWDWQPWGCGVAYKGGPSCNAHWIQFEICEDGLNDENYFNQVYKEACELTAYLCDIFNIDPNGTVDFAGQKIPTILCHADSYTYRCGCNHGDVNHWFPKFGKNMTTARADVAKLLATKPPVVQEVQPEPTPVEPTPVVTLTTKELYRIRKSWTDHKSQVGAYSSLTNAIAACKKFGTAYKVFDSKGEVVYPEQVIIESETKFKVGDMVRLLPGATYATGSTIPKWLFAKDLYVRQIKSNGVIIFSIVKTGPITGAIKPTDIELCGDLSNSAPEEEFEPYLVKITTDVLNVRAGAGVYYKVVTQVKKNQIYTITGEKGGWGRLKSGAGWIDLGFTKKI